MAKAIRLALYIFVMGFVNEKILDK